MTVHVRFKKSRQVVSVVRFAFYRIHWSFSYSRRQSSKYWDPGLLPIWDTAPAEHTSPPKACKAFFTCKLLLRAFVCSYLDALKWHMRGTWHLLRTDAWAVSACLFVSVVIRRHVVIACFVETYSTFPFCPIPYPHKPTPANFPVPSWVTTLPPIVRALLVIFSFSVLWKCVEITIGSDVSSQYCNWNSKHGLVEMQAN